MKEELIRVLNYKLDDINSDITSLIDLNNKIDEEQEKTSFVSKILGLFNGNDNSSLMNFVKIEKEDFKKVLDLAGDEVKNIFSTDSCNYDGLVYLINGINSGVSLTLTDEQKNGIRYLIDTLTGKKQEFDATINDYNSTKANYEISDVEELNKKKDKYTEVISDIKDNNYIKDIDLLKESISFSSLTPENTIDLLTYVLQYNADLYKEGKKVSVEEVKEEVKEEVEIPQETVAPIEEKEDVKEDNDFHFNSLENDSLFDLPNITFDEIKPEEEKEDIKEENEYQEYTPVEPTEEVQEEPVEEVEMPVEPSVEVEEVTEPADNFTPVVEPTVSEEPTEEEPKIDSDFSDVINETEDYDTAPEVEVEDEKTSTRELQKIFSKYGIEENVVLNELIDGNVNEYQKVLDMMKDKDILDYVKGNKELLVEILLYSNTDVIEKVLKIIKEDLSVDDEDYNITLRIAINTIPSIFVKDGGNYDNFVKNVELFKDLEINLINLFDFSKEVFVADHDKIKENLDIVNKYDFDINYKNAKYFLLIPNIADKLDYYIESVYEDKNKHETFDGINYIKEYTAKLNVVTDETIKRLRYSSENGKKVFGSKPGSLSGEITNLKVNALDISGDYMSKFFNNEFATLTGDEVREYVKLVHNSSNVGDYTDELDKLNSYRDGLRYNIDGIRVSYNKVVRNYSVLRSYGIDSKKALQFAVCYNLVITKDEYDKLNSLLDKIGGNV